MVVNFVLEILGSMVMNKVQMTERIAKSGSKLKVFCERRKSGSKRN